MTKRKPSAMTPNADQIAGGIARIKIEDEEEEITVPEIDLTGLDDEQEGVDAIREVTPTEEQLSSDVPDFWVLIESARLRDEEFIRPGDSVQFHIPDPEEKSGFRCEFLHNIRIYQDLSTDQIIVDGDLVRRMKYAGGMLSRNKVNEVYVTLKAPRTGQDAGMRACCARRPLSDAVCKRKIIFTNQPFPAHSVYAYPYYPTDSLPEIRERAQLVCRWRFTEETMNSGSKVTAGSMMTLSEEECDRFNHESRICRLKEFHAEKEGPLTYTEAIKTDERVFLEVLDDEQVSLPMRRLKRPHYVMDTVDLTTESDKEVIIVEHEVNETIKRLSSSEWRTTTKRETLSATTKRTITTNRSSIKRAFPATKPSHSSTGGISSPGPTTLQGNRSRGRKVAALMRYTFGDLCAGAGGMTSGAKQAGFKLNFLLDHWETACNTLRRNFTNFHTDVLLKSIHDFCSTDWYYDSRCTVLHISFPCQPHSPAHTIEGRNDDHNIATSYSVGAILEKCKSRIVTFEQTSGIVTHNGGIHFRALIRQITDCGYSVRWKICNLAEYGNVQPRKRLIVIAACPGEVLPQIPEPTHGVGPGKLRLVTIQDILDKIHGLPVPPELARCLLRDAQPYDPNQPLRTCITCDGGISNLHPSGKRTFTLFELAALQGFLPNHRFTGSKSDIMKQIGNAVPSCVAKILFEHISKSLQESDRQIAAWKPETVILDDE